jgi:hypothetical protein
MGMTGLAGQDTGTFNGYFRPRHRSNGRNNLMLRYNIKKLSLVGLLLLVLITACTGNSQVELSRVGATVNMPRDWLVESLEEAEGYRFFSKKFKSSDEFDDKVTVTVTSISCVDYLLDDNCSETMLLNKLKEDHLTSYSEWELGKEEVPNGMALADLLYQAYTISEARIYNPSCTTAHWHNVFGDPGYEFGVPTMILRFRLIIVGKCEHKTFLIDSQGMQPYTSGKPAVDIIVAMANSLRELR